MTRWRGPGRYGGIAVITLAVLIVAAAALPVLISLGPHALSVARGRASPPNEGLVVSTPVALGLSGLVTIERGTLYPADTAGRPVQVPMTAAQITSGTGRFMIENGSLRIQSGQQTKSGDAQPAIIDALSGLQFDTLMLRNTSVHVQLPVGRTETISDIDGEVFNRRKSSLVIKGTGAMRGQKIEFEATSGVPADARPGATIPIKLIAKTALFEATLDGRAGFVGPTQLRGTIDFSVPKIRQVARWFGANWPAGNGLRNVTGHGLFDWSGPAMAFNRATFHVDGNEAHGTLNLRFLEARPFIGGTLAFKTFDLSKYFPAEAAGTPAAIGATWQSLSGVNLNAPLLHHFDADIRLSADKVLFNQTLLGRTAVTLTVSRDRMLADIGAVEFDGGRAGGQVIADMSGPVPKFAVRGKIEDVDASRATLGLFGHAVLSGRATLTADLTSTGVDVEEFLKSSSGRLNFALRNGGKLGLDLAGLVSGVQKRALIGWGTYGRNPMAFDELDASFLVKAGRLIGEDVQAKSGDVVTRMDGTIDVLAASLNLQVKRGPTEDLPVPPSRTAQPRSIEISGPWARPSIRSQDPAPPAPTPLEPPSISRNGSLETTSTPARL